MLSDRYITYTEDKAEAVERKVEELVEKTNERLRLYGAKIEANLIFREDMFNGFVGVSIRFDKKEPGFLTENDKTSWHRKVKGIAKSRFGFDPNIGGKDLDYLSIGFRESSEEELYALTERKEIAFEEGFDNVENFCKWYNSAVTDYEAVVQAHFRRFNEHLRDL